MTFARWFARRHGRREPGTYLGGGQVDSISGSYAVSVIARGGLEAPSTLRGRDGDLFAYAYFGETQASRDIHEIAASLSNLEDASPKEFEAELYRRVAERTLERFREWQKNASS